MCIFAAMNENILPIHFAPLQGYTDAVYRRAHARIFGGIETYYSPFVRMEHGEIRRKDARDIEPDNNPDLHLIPQLIAPDADKLEHIMSLFIEKGYQEVDINLGCPFPLLAKRHNGSGILPYPEEVKALLSIVTRYPQISFSIFHLTIQYWQYCFYGAFLRPRALQSFFHHLFSSFSEE